MAFIIKVDAILFIQKGCDAYDFQHGRSVTTASAETNKSKLNIEKEAKTMISIETYREIQKHKDYGVSMLKASQIMKLSYNTVYKWWNLTENDFNAFQSEHEFILDNYRQYFIEQLKITPQMNNTLLYKRLKTDFEDIEIPISTFHRYIKNLREQTGLINDKTATANRTSERT